MTRPTRPLLAALALGATTLSTLCAQSTATKPTGRGPDPDIFDGTRTKAEQITPSEQRQTDKWQDANLILYDSDEQGSAEGGQGRSGGTQPGYADGAQGGTGMQAGIPNPLAMGGGSGQPDQQSPQGMPIGGESGIETAQPQGNPGAAPTSDQSSPTAGGQQGQRGPSGKPGEVSIGDSSQRIAQAAQTQSKVSSGGAPPPTGEEIQPSKGEDTTTIPNSASGQQSQQRGGGVEKGDAMPTDI